MPVDGAAAAHLCGSHRAVHSHHRCRHLLRQPRRGEAVARAVRVEHLRELVHRRRSPTRPKRLPENSHARHSTHNVNPQHAPHRAACLTLRAIEMTLGNGAFWGIPAPAAATHQNFAPSASEIAAMAPPVTADAQPRTPAAFWRDSLHPTHDLHIIRGRAKDVSSLCIVTKSQDARPYHRPRVRDSPLCHWREVR